MSGSGPGYWMHETSGLLRPAVEAYLADQPMTQDQIALMRAYLSQWIKLGDWRGPEIERLRASVETIRTKSDITRWLDVANEWSIDPL